MAASVNDPMGHTLPPAPAMSLMTLPITGILVDIYGVSEIPPTATNISILWLHHPLQGDKSRMRDIAARCISAWYTYTSTSSLPPSTTSVSSSNSSNGSTRALIACAFDQRNHGTRRIDAQRNQNWKGGNSTHAKDMLGFIVGMVSDTQMLMDVIGAYIFDDIAAKGRVIDQHLCLGVSLGGHSAWQLMFKDPRVVAGVVVIGCPDYVGLMKDRARLSSLSTYSADDEGASFLGSRDFPPELVRICDQNSPRSILFGTRDDISSQTTSEAEQDRLRGLLEAHVCGKRFLLCSGADDKLVPYKRSEAFVDWFKNAAETWYQDGGVTVENKIYKGAGHVFSTEMIIDSIKFIVDAVASADDGSGGSGNEVHNTATSKI